jgi:hypothetical protein
MYLDDAFPYFFVLVVVLVAAAFLFKLAKHGSFKGAMFGSAIERTVGEVSAARGTMVTTLLRVHVLRGDVGSETTIGVEFVAKSFASYQMLPISLTNDEARTLIRLLESALSSGPSRGAA